MIERLPTVPALLQEFDSELAQAKSARDAQTVRDKWLGRKKGVVAQLMDSIASAAPEDRKKVGQTANELKHAIEARWTAYVDAGHLTETPAGAVDVTLPGRAQPLGHRHPLTVVRDRMEEIFTRMGFTIVEGPEAEDEWHCFDALNMPADHPARDMQDTLYLTTSIQGGDGNAERRTLLRTH